MGGKMELNNSVRSAETDYRAILQDLRRFLSYQGPIKDFVADNILYMFRDMDLNFHEALRKASSLYGSLEYRPIAEYRKAYHDGKITDQAIDFVLTLEGEDKKNLLELLFHHPVPAEMRRSGFRERGYLYTMTSRHGIIPEECIHPILYRFIANYLDQGIAAISMAEYAESFWSALQKQLAVSRPLGLSRRISRLIADHSAEETIGICITELLPASADIKTFLLEVLVVARGWSGLVAQIEARPAALNYPRQIALADYVALYLLLLTDCLAGTGYKPETLHPENPNSNFFKTRAPAETEQEKIYRLWHDAREMSLYFSLLGVIAKNAPLDRQRSTRVGRADFHAIFCIDDREESIRRHLEEVSGAVETFGAPGFFGIDMVYQGPFDAIAVKQCPVPVTPRHKVRGLNNRKRKSSLSRIEMNFWHRHSNNLFVGSIISLVFGLVSLIRMAFSVHLPSRSFAMVSPLSIKEDATHVHYERADNEEAKDGYFEGYTVVEMADRVGRILTQIGLTSDFGALVVLVGHGSSSTNNPYFAAYDCGACSGRPGFANARVFALMANRDDVRQILRERGIDIPVATQFIGALHDTTRDEINFVDEENLEAAALPKLAQLKASFHEALRRTAVERVRRFELVPFTRSEQKAQKEVVVRSEMLFEPRPEYTHATNALGIVAPRSLTENLFLDRRAFFNSYDPRADQNGKILSDILTPFVSVCGGINLAYYFSYLDSTAYGSGSKLPHNIFSLIGIGNGIDGDLRSGLPEQMTEIHEPIRLFLLIEQTREIVLRVFENNAPVYAWIKMDWVKCAVYDYVQKKYFLYRNGNLVELIVPENDWPAFPESRAIFGNRRGTIEPAVIVRHV